MTHINRGIKSVAAQWDTSIGSDKYLSPGRRKAIIWTNDGYIIDEYIYIYIFTYVRHSASVS